MLGFGSACISECAAFPASLVNLYVRLECLVECMFPLFVCLPVFVLVLLKSGSVRLQTGGATPIVASADAQASVVEFRAVAGALSAVPSTSSYLVPSYVVVLGARVLPPEWRRPRLELGATLERDSCPRASRSVAWC